MGSVFDILKGLNRKSCKYMNVHKSSNEWKCVTAFVDESLHRVAWNENGVAGISGSFSYIICHGKIWKESKISKKNILIMGTDYINEQRHVEVITKAAIEKVLIIVAYDYEYTGKVRIFTDNQSVQKHWMNYGRNSRLSNLFDSVIVKYIPREKNVKADSLCRERMHLDIPIATYKELVRKCARADELEEKIKDLKAVI